MRSTPSQAQVSNASQGFTLIEMLIAVAVLAILAAIAIPSYQSYIIKSEIRTAQSELLSLALNFENRYQRTLAYPTVTVDDSDAITSTFTSWSPSASHFAFTASTSTATAYTLVATGSGRQAGCSISINEKNERSTNGCQFTSGSWL